MIAYTILYGLIAVAYAVAMRRFTFFYWGDSAKKMQATFSILAFVWPLSIPISFYVLREEMVSTLKGRRWEDDNIEDDQMREEFRAYLREN